MKKLKGKAWLAAITLGILVLLLWTVWQNVQTFNVVDTTEKSTVMLNGSYSLDGGGCACHSGRADGEYGDRGEDPRDDPGLDTSLFHGSYFLSVCICVVIVDCLFCVDLEDVFHFEFPFRFV